MVLLLHCCRLSLLCGNLQANATLAYLGAPLPVRCKVKRYYLNRLKLEKMFLRDKTSRREKEDQKALGVGEEVHIS